MICSYLSANPDSIGTDPRESNEYILHKSFLKVVLLLIHPSALWHPYSAIPYLRIGQNLHSNEHLHRVAYLPALADGFYEPGAPARFPPLRKCLVWCNHERGSSLGGRRSGEDSQRDDHLHACDLHMQAVQRTGIVRAADAPSVRALMRPSFPSFIRFSTSLVPTSNGASPFSKGGLLCTRAVLCSIISCLAMSDRDCGVKWRRRPREPRPRNRARTGRWPAQRRERERGVLSVAGARRAER